MALTLVLMLPSCLSCILARARDIRALCRAQKRRRAGNLSVHRPSARSSGWIRLRAGVAPIEHGRRAPETAHGRVRHHRHVRAEARRQRFRICRRTQHGRMRTNIRTAIHLASVFFVNRIDSADIPGAARAFHSMSRHVDVWVHFAEIRKRRRRISRVYKITTYCLRNSTP